MYRANPVRGLRSGEIFKLQDEQYKVAPGDNGLRAAPVKKPESKKQISRHRG